MTISSEVNRSGPYQGNGVTKSFDYKFKISNETHIQVIKTDVLNVDSTLALGADYSVSGIGVDQGGAVLLSTAPLAGEKVTLLLNVPFTQETDLENQGAYYAEVVEAAFDLVTQQTQQLRERLGRAVVIPPSASTEEIDALIGYILALSGSTGPIAAVAAVAQYLEAVAAVADDIPDVAGLTQTTTQKASEAAQSATDASDSADLAAEWATNPEDTPVTGSGGLFSAFHWYRKTLALYSSVAAGIAGMFHSAPAKTAPVDGDEFAIADSEDGYSLKRVSGSDLIGYVVGSSGLDAFTNFVPSWVSQTQFRVSGGTGVLSGIKYRLAAGMTMSLNAPFGVGDGCLDTGSIVPSQTYCIYLIKHIATGDVKFIASRSGTAAGVTLPAGYMISTQGRVGMLLTNTNGAIVQFLQEGNKVNISSTIIATYGSSGGSVNLPPALISVPYIPTGISVDALVAIQAQISNAVGPANVNASAGPAAGLAALPASVPSVAITSTRLTSDGQDISTCPLVPIRTDTSGRIERSLVSSGSMNVDFVHNGWIDWQCRRLWG